jgi:hypothetical protein
MWYARVGNVQPDRGGLGCAYSASFALETPSRLAIAVAVAVEPPSPVVDTEADALAVERILAGG